MSMMLILWKAPVVDDPDEAEKLLSASYETGDDRGLESSEDIAGLPSKLRSRWRDVYESDPPQDCPWADVPLKGPNKTAVGEGVRHNLLPGLRTTIEAIVPGQTSAGH